MNIDLLVKLKTPGNENFSKVKAFFDKEYQVINYVDEEETKTIFYINDKKLIRDNQNIYMEYIFKEDEITNNKILVKNIDQTIYVNIKLIKFIKKENFISLKYQIVDANEECEYILEY